VSISNGALTAVRGPMPGEPHASVTLTRAAFDAILLKEGDPAQLFASGEITVSGQAEKLGELMALLDEGESAFAVVTP
jgi:alkyl sulfatase BDS1-like metallo-beta-lactamase superfamily hydrolase